MADVESDDGGGHPVEITPTQAERLAEKRRSLFEEFEIGDRFPRAVRTEVLERTTDVAGEIEAAIDDREDLRDLPTWTIDPIDAQDFDDAISIVTEESTIRLWVHIADVSHYVQPGTAMWTEAIARGNTVYLPGYTVHMLPPVLAETVCSLVPAEDRLAHTVEMELDPETLSFESIDIHKSIIHSDARLTYREAEAILDGDAHPLADAIGEMYTLAEGLHEQRKADGSLVLNPRRDRAHTIVEEAMLKANRAVTHELMWNRGVEAMYRVHPQPTPSQWDQALREIVEIDGVSISRAGYDAPRRAVNEALESAAPRHLNRIQRAVLKVMPRAKYMADPFGGHYALNFDIYGHFTSPIRRLSDLINHWIVHEEAVEESVDELCAHASRRQKETETAERLYRQFIEELGLDAGTIRAYGAVTVEDGEIVDPEGLPPA
jgi:ribonuclease R